MPAIPSCGPSNALNAPSSQALEKNRGQVRISTHLMARRHPSLAHRKFESQQQVHDGNSASGADSPDSGKTVVTVCAVAALLVCTYFHARNGRTRTEINVAPEQQAFARARPASASAGRGASASASRMMALAQAQRQQFHTLTQQNLHPRQPEEARHHDGDGEHGAGARAEETVDDRRLNALYDAASN